MESQTQYTEIHRDLIEACKRGERSAQFALYKLYAKAMLNVAWRVCNSVPEAEDMLQDAFTEAFLNLHTFRYESAFGAWLKRIVLNRCLNQLKKRRVELMPVDSYDGLNHVEKADDDENENLQLTVKGIQDAIQQLSDGYRVVFSLYMFEGYDHAEIAEILNISESTSKSQYLRARRKIREIMEKGTKNFNIYHEKQ